MALSLHHAQLFAASAQLAFGPLNRDSGAGARAGWVLEDPDGYCTKDHCRDWKNPGSETIPAAADRKEGAARSRGRCAPREGGTATSRCKCVSYCLAYLKYP